MQCFGVVEMPSGGVEPHDPFIRFYSIVIIFFGGFDQAELTFAKLLNKIRCRFKYAACFGLEVFWCFVLFANVL